MRHYKKMTVDLGFQTFCFHTHLRRSLEHVPFELRLRAGDSDDCLPGHWNFSACHLGCGAGGLRLCCIFAMGKWYVFVRKEGTPKPKLIHWSSDFLMIAILGVYRSTPFSYTRKSQVSWGTSQEQWIWSCGAPLGAIPVDSYSRWIVGYQKPHKFDYVWYLIHQFFGVSTILSWAIQDSP